MSMSIKLLFYRRRVFHRLRQTTSFFRRLSSGADIGETCSEDETNEKSLANRVIDHLEQTPDNELVASQALDSLLFSSSFSAPSPRFLSEITCRLKSYHCALSFFKYLNHNSRYLKNHEECLSSAFQSALMLATREPDFKTKLVELYKAFKEMNVPLTVNTVKLLIRMFDQAEMVDNSLLVYEELSPGMRNTEVRNVLIGVLLRRERVNDALKVLDEMLNRESEFLPDEITGNIVFSFLRSDSKVSPLTDIVGLVMKLSENCVFPNSIWLTRFITRLCRNGGTYQAMDLLEYLMKQKAPLEASSINALLSGFARVKDISKMNALLTKMKEVGISPDAVTFGILINNLCKSRRVDEALKLFESMRRGEGGNEIMVTADLITYNTLIDGLCKIGRLEEGEKLLERMRTEEGCAPNTISYNCLIDGFCRAGDIEKAQWLIEQMKKEGIEPSVVTLNTVVGGMCRHSGVSSAVQYFRNKQKDGLKGNVVTYTILVNAFCNVNNLDKAINLFNEMVEAGCSPDAMIYYTLISGLCSARRADDATMMVSKLKRAGFSLDLVAYNMLIGLFCDTKKFDRVQEILNDMEESGVKADAVTHNTMISFFSKNKDFKSAHRVMRKMINEGFQPTIVTYGAIIHAYCSDGDIHGAMKLYKEMCSGSRIIPNTVIYNILIESFCKKNDVGEALSLMDDMKRNGIKPNTTTYNAVLKGLKSRNLLDKAFDLMDEMIEHACLPDLITMEILTTWFSDVGKTEKLKTFVQKSKVTVPGYKLGMLYK